MPLVLNLALLCCGTAGLADTAGAAPAGEAGAVTISRAADAGGQPVDIGAARSQPRTERPSAVAGGKGQAPVRTTMVRPATVRTTGGFGWRVHPLLGGVRLHRGIDLAGPYGAPIHCASEGVVVGTGWHGGYGLLVTLAHPSGLQTRYAHLGGIAVGLGQRVRRGDVIGYVGTTGLSTGPHLHYEVRINGMAIDPLPHRR
ncbi:M23 family metallopeptidase [Novosphingobium bradum]|uniref:M23 family metallopeptidase n=1 Tax=Novosphingobium bradum TaxID=1737444 RepID=A0ABV7IQY2_9SPHN